MNENKCCATCDRAAQLYIGDTPTVYRFCQLSGAIPHLPHEYCEDYIPKEVEKGQRVKPTKREIELASEVSSLKVQIEFIKEQVNDNREVYAKIAKEALELAEEYKKENEEMKRLLKLISEETDCLATFRYADEIEKLIGGKINEN